MNYPQNPSDEFYFQIPSDDYYSMPIQTAPLEDQILLHDPMMDVIGSGGHVLPCTSQKGKGKKKQKQLLPTTWGAEDNNINHQMDENKKWMHRETEKQRRQEMARLCTTFRSLLPLECIKGKRSTSDHMLEGVKYIKNLKNRVEELQGRRDMLMKLSNLSGPDESSGISTTTTTNLLPPTYVLVEPFPEGGGVQIKCSHSFRKHVFPLSRMLDIVLKQGLNVVNCTSIKTNDRFIHTIRSEDPHMMMTETDYTELQRKLTGAISFSSLEEAV